MGREIKIFIVLHLMGVVSHTFSNWEQGSLRGGCTTLYLFPNGIHVMLYSICRYPFMVDGLEEEAGIGGIGESESELTNGFFKLLRYEDLYNAYQNAACSFE